MRNIIGVGFSIPSKEDDYLKFDSNGSLSDADIAVFAPNFTEASSYDIDSYNPTHQGKTLYSEYSSFLIKEHLDHWKNEIDRFLKAGKTVIVLLAAKHEFLVYTGERQSSGTGRNQSTTKNVDISSNYDFLPIPNLRIVKATGSKIYPQAPITKNLYECCKDFFQFQSYIEVNHSPKSILFATKNRDKILGLNLSLPNGHLVFLPYIEIPDNFYTEAGNVNKQGLNFGLRFKTCLAELVDAIENEIEKTPVPEWALSERYNLRAAENTKTQITNKLEEIMVIEKEVDELKKVLSEQESLKDLLFESGKRLELAVRQSLKLLGYTAENFNDGVLELDQVILSPENDRFIGECEGKDNKDIDISKFRQLVDALNEDFARDEVEDKAWGILIGNPQRLLEPDKRTLDFTAKCRNGALREKVALVKTVDLFVVAKYLADNDDEDYKLACRKAIKEQFGSIVIFPLPPLT